MPAPVFPSSLTSPALLAQTRRRRAQIVLLARADPYADEMKKIAEGQKLRAKVEKQAAKDAEDAAREQEKQAEEARKAALRESNNAKEAQYRRDGRPMYVDADGVIQSQVTDEEWTQKKAQKAKNDALRTQFFKEQRPWVEDAAGNIVPRHSDEEWQALKNEKAAKLEAAKVDKANEALRKERKQEITGVQRGMTDAREAINLRTSEMELQHSEATAQAKRRADFIKQTQDAIENGLDLAPERVARMEQAIAAAQKELEQWQAKADALDAEVRSQKAGEVAFRRAQQPVASAMQAAEDAIPTLSVQPSAPMGVNSPPKPGGLPSKTDAPAVPGVRDTVLSHQQAAVASDPTLPAAKRKAALEDIAARRDPVAYADMKRLRLAKADVPTLKAALDEEGPALESRITDYKRRGAALEAAAATWQQPLQVVLQRNQARLQQPHRGSDLVTVEGPDGQPMSVFTDLADEYQTTLAEAQEKRTALQGEADALDTEAEELRLDQQLYREAVDAYNAKVQAEEAARRKTAQQEQDAKLRRMELTGQAGPAAKIRAMQSELAAERAVIDEMFPENSPEKQAQLDKLRQKAEQKQAAIAREAAGLQRFGAMMYERFKDVSTNFMERSTTDAEGIQASDTTNQIIDDAAKAKGLNPEDVRRVMETQRVLDWSKPLTGNAARMQENLLSGLYEKEYGPIEATRRLPDGTVIPNPVLGGDKAAFDKAIADSGAPKAQQEAAQKLWPEYQRRFGEAAVDALMRGTGPGSFSAWREHLIEEDQRVQGRNGFAAMSPGKQALLYIEQQRKRGGMRQYADLIASNLYAGFGDLATQVLGMGAAVTGSEDLSNLAVANAQNMESVLVGQEYGGPKGLAAGIVGQSARMLPGLAATVGTGSLGGAIAMGAAQTGGANYAETYQALREAGASHDEAWNRSAIGAYVSGAMTAALTKAFPGGATAMLRPGAAAAGKQAMKNAVLNAVKAVSKGFADEVPQEVLDEGFSQLTAAVSAGKPLRTAVQEFVTNLPELIGAAGLMGGLGGALENKGDRTANVSPPVPQPPPQAEAENIAPEAANISAPASNISPASRESELSKPDMGSEGAGDRFMAARGAVAAWDGGSMPEAKKAVTKAKAEVLIKIAEGAAPADLEQEELMAVGLRREDDGRITSGYLTNKGDWKKGVRPDGFTSVELLDGQFIITDRQVDRLRKVGMDAVADAIALPAAERRKQIVGEEPAPEPAPEPAAKADTPAQAVVNKPVSASEDVIPMEWAAEKPDVETLRQGEEEQSTPPSLVSPEVKQRTAEIATVLEKSGVPREVVLDVASKAVEAAGIDPDGYASQMMQPAFDAAMKAQGWVRKASNPMQWERAEVSKARTGAEMAADKAGMTPAEVVRKPDTSEAGRSARAPVSQELSSREDWRAAREAALRTELAKLEKLKDRAKAKEEFTKITRADKILVDLVDNRYGALFDEVQIGTSDSGLAAKPLAVDEKGRATRVALVIDPANFYAHGGLAPLEIEKALDEELKHRVDLMVTSRKEAIDLARAIHNARPGVFDRTWKSYYAIGIRDGSVPAQVPAVLTDDQAFMLYFEATRMIHQGTLTTETIQDVGTLRQIWRYLQSWLKHVRREMRKLPRELLGEWNARIEAAQKLLQKLEKRAIALEKAALDDVEPPESAVRKPRESRQPKNDPDLDAEIQAAWESEQKSRRHVPTFTPTQQVLRRLRQLKDPDNDEVNILSRIAMEGGIAIYSDKVRKLRKQQNKPTGGELDWLEKANIPPFWKGIVFRRGHEQNVDTIVGQLFDEGYFPQAAEAGDVTGEMLAAKIEDVLDRYQALKNGQGDLADSDEQYGTEMAKLERQRVEFERATADGPLKVRPADLKPGDVMQVKGDDGQLHPVEVLRLETRPLEAGEDYDPQANPGHRMGPDGPEVIESVTLKDGNTFGVQMVDGQEGLYVDEFKLRDAYDFYTSLRGAIQRGSIDDAEALLSFMDHEGMLADTSFADIVTGLQSKLRIPMKKAQKMLAAVFDTTPKPDKPWTEEEKAATLENPLGNARKRGDAGPSMFGEDFDLLSGDSQNRGLFEQALGTRAAVEAAPAGFALEAVTPQQLDAEMAKAARKAKLRDKLRARQDAPLIGTMGDIGQMDMLGGGDLFAQPIKPRDTASQDAPATPGTVEPDRPRNVAGDTGRPRGVQRATGTPAADAGRLGAAREAGQDAPVGGDAAAGGAAPAAGSGSAEPVQAEAPRVPERPAGGEQPRGSSGIDDTRAAVESGAELDLSPIAPKRPDRDEVADERRETPRERQLSQVQVDNTPSIWDGFKVADEASIAKSLPMLLPQQQQDVLKAERRFFVQSATAEDPKKGILFTNGTGTGKTFTGLGIVKRFQMMGKGRVLIVVPNQQKVADWQAEGERVMVRVRPLKDTQDIGEDVVVTTYANMRENWRLQAEPWDLVVYDESHYLGSNAQGEQTANIAAHELVTAKPGWKLMQKWIQAELGPPPPWDDKDAVRRYENEAEQAWKRIQYRADTAPDTKAVFLSATPFAYHKSLTYADGFLFQTPAHTGSSAYNTPQGFDRYLVENFGYRMKTNRLNSPPPEVDQGLMEREWAERMFQSGAMSGRMIDVPHDYSREFVLLDSQTGKLLDDGFASLSGYGPDSRANRDRWPELMRAFDRYWHSSSTGYTRMMQFMESIKVADAIERMQQHLGMGRKIVLFHSYNNADPIHPFQLGYLSPPFRDDPAQQIAEARALEEQARDWMAAHPALVQMNFKRLQNPRQLVQKEFGDRVRFFNGEVSKKDRAAAIKAFNDDASGVDILMVQSDAGKEGISLHDTTGGRQRVLMNAGLPIKPTDAIQTEGRIYRIGVKSNAVQEYLVIHTGMERSAFGSKISQRTGTVENMALGKMARTLTDSFKSGYLNAHSEAPSAEQGLGGKKQDAAELLGSDMDRAKSYYFSRQKKTSKTKAAEGQDYFATPEPVGLTMVRFLNAKAGDDLLEPSAGHGAIGRFFPDFTANKFVEPSKVLSDELRIKVASGKVEVMPFEDLHVGANKFDGIAMNPPFGTAGKLAMEHVAKAAQHLRQGGRLVAIIPEGPAMQKRFDQWLENEGRDMHLRASYGLPTVTFERAGTSVKTRIVVLDKADLWTIRNNDGIFAAYDSFGEKRSTLKGSEKAVRELLPYMPDFIGLASETPVNNRSHRELTADTINELFDELENLTPPGRITKNTATGDVSESVPPPMPVNPQSVPAKPPSPLAAFLQGGRSAVIPTAAEQATAAAQAPALVPTNSMPAPPPAGVAAASKPLYNRDQTLHAKRGTMTYVAKMSRRISDAAFNAERTRAKKHGGYWSSFKGLGAIPGFQFPSAEARDQFVTEGSQQALGAARKRGDTPPAAPFYSKLAQVIEQKMPNRADAKTIWGLITNPQTGIKQEELKWSGILPWLEEQARRAEGEGLRVSKQAVLDYLASDGAVVLEEVRRGGMADAEAFAAQQRKVTAANQALIDFLVQNREFDERGAREYALDAARGDLSEPQWRFVNGDPEQKALVNNLRDAYAARAETPQTRFDKYQLPGGENYREVVLAMPEKAQRTPAQAQQEMERFGEELKQKYGVENWLRSMTPQERETLADLSERARGHKESSNYTSSHFPDVPNYVAHMRLNDREDAEGRTGTFIEEIQSDRHQAGREKGYRGDDHGKLSPRAEVIDRGDQYAERFIVKENGFIIGIGETREAAVADASSKIVGRVKHDAIPDAPFRKDWPLQMFKRALAEAVAQGKQWIGWTTGDTQAGRYDLSKQLSRISYEPNEDGTFDFEAYPLNDDLNPVISESGIDLKRIEELAGKEVAKKVEAREGDKDKDGYRDWHHLRGLNLRVGGEGMKGFYDTILPKEIGKYVKQWGAGVVKSLAYMGGPKFYIRAEDGTLGGSGRNRAEAEQALAWAQQKWPQETFKIEPSGTPIWRVDITPAMRAGVEAGQALFASRKRGEQRAESGESERVVAAALRDPRTGRVFTGVTHGDANPRDKKQLDLAANGADPQDGIGFVTSTGRYVTQAEADRVWGIQGSESSAAYWEASKPEIVDGEGDDGWVDPMSEADWKAELDRRRAAEAEMAGRSDRSPVERSAWSMVDTDTENSGVAAGDMLHWQHDPALRAPGSRIDEMLTRLESEWQKDAGAVAADRSIQAGRVSDPHDSRGGSEALVFARTFEQLTGKQIVWINTRPEAGIPFRAAVIRDRPNTIFVHVRAQGNVLALIGHEWGHTLASQDPDLYRELQRQLAAFISRADGKQMRKELVDRYHRRVRSEEVTNNIIGDFFTEPAFWRKVEAQDSGLLKRLLDSVRQWFDRLAALARSQWGTGARLQNIEAARRAVAQAFTEALKRGPYSELGPVDDAALTQVDQAAHEAATSPLNDLPEPTEAQREAGNYKLGHVRIAGHEISIENPAGSKRRPEWPALKDHYGYFKGTNAKDGDHVDVFVKPGTPEDYAGPVHVIRQNKVERQKSEVRGEKSEMSPEVYHATDSDFDQFREGDDLVIHFGTLKAAQERAAAKGLKAPRLIKARLQGPFVEVSDRNNFGDEMMWELVQKGVLTAKEVNAADEEVMNEVGQGDDFAPYKRLLERKGFKGITYVNQSEDKGSRSYGVFRADSVKPTLTKTGQFDEYKVMLGYPTAEEAREAYLRNYEPGWPGLHKLTTHSPEEFQKIKDQVFTVPADRVPGVRASDQALASGVKRASSPITPEQDAEYLAAVQAGDMDKAQRMVDAAARAAGYEIKAWHGSPDARFLKTDPVFRQKFRKTNVQWFAKDRRAAATYADDRRAFDYQNAEPATVQMFLKLTNPLFVHAKGQHWRDAQQRGKTSNVIEEAQSLGHDGVIITDVQDDYQSGGNRKTVPTTTYATFSAEQIKSADPVTRDAAGNVIPLSKRFNPESDSILYAAPKRRDNPAAAPGVIPPAATAEDFARPDNALLRGMSNADWNRLDKGIKKRLDRILEPIVRYASAKGDAAVEKMLDWVVGESLEGLEHAAGTTIEDVQQRKAAREALKAQARRAWQKTARQVMPDATVPADVIAKMREMRAAESLSQEKALDVSKRALEGKTKLLDIMAGTKAEEFKSPDVRRKMYLAMNAKINSGVTMDDLTPEQRAVALALKRAWWENGMRRVRNGTLKLETFQDMAEGLPQYYEDDVNLEKGFIPRAFKMGLKGLIAQRSTRFHIVDKTSKDKSGEFALVNWTDPSTKRTDWKYKSKAHMDAAYEQIIEDQILVAKDARAADYGKLAPDDIRTLRQYTWMTDADRAALAGVTREKLRQPASLTPEQKAVVDRMTEQLHRRFQKKVPLTYQQHEKAGLIQDPFYAIGRALLESGHDNATAEFFNYIAKQPDYIRDVAENGFTAMPDDPKMGRLAGKWVRDDVAAELEQMIDVPNMVMRFYDALLAGFKYGHTILNLGSHVRNILGNVSFAVLAGSNPLLNAKAYAEANKLLREGGPTFEALHKLGILGGDYLTNEVRRALRQLLPDPDTVERMIAAQDMSWLTGLKEQMARKLDKGGSVLAAVPRAMENAWKWEDDIYKVAAFIKARQQGLSEAEAAAHVRKWFPFYDKGSSGTLKALGRFVFPFLSFKRESLRIMGHALRERPLAFLTMMAIPRLLTQLSFTILELQLIAGMAGLGDDDEEDLLKDMKGKAGGLLAPFTDASLFSIALPWRDASGGMAQWDLSAVIPWSDWLSTRIEYGAEKPWFQRVASQIVSGAPFASLLVETWANQDTFSGRRIWEDDMSGTEKAGKLAGHVYMKLAPPMIGPHIASMVRAMEQQPSKLLPQRNPTQALMRILGLDIKPLSPDLYRKAEEYRKAKGAPAAPRGGQAFPQDAASRARARLYLELIQPEIDVQAADEAFAALDALGEPVRTLKDLSDLFKDRSPETIMPAKMRPGFVQSLPPESRRVYDSARTQQGEAFTRSKSVLQQRAEARRKAAGVK